MPSTIKGAHNLWSGSGGRVETGGMGLAILLNTETDHRRFLSLASENARRHAGQNHLTAERAAITRASSIGLARFR